MSKSTPAFTAPSPEALGRAAARFKMLSDATRLRIVAAVGEKGEMHVTDLCTMLGQSQPAVSHHLSLLRVSDVLTARREGKHNFYGLGEHGAAALRAVEAMGA